MARGLGWSYNPGELTGAATAPLWVALIIPLFSLPGDTTVSVKLLGSLLYMADVLLIAGLTWQITGDRRAALVAGLLSAWQPTFTWAALSGMETPLYLLLTLLGIRSLFQTESSGAMMAVAYASTAWLTLAGWARPEIWALIPLAWAYLIYQDRKSQRSPPGGCPRAWLLHVAIACVGIGAFAIFNMAMWGQPFPSTLTGKAAFFQTWGGLTPGKMLTKLAELFLHNIQAIVDSQNPLAVICIGAAIVSARRQREQRSARLRQRPKIAWLGLALLLSILVASATPPGDVAFQTYRRIAHVLALTIILAAIGLMAIWSALKPDTAQCLSGDAGARGPEAATWSRILRPEAVFLVAAVLLIAGMQWSGLQKGAEFYGQATRSINQGDVVAGRWLAANTPADALVVVNDIGALAYFGERRILDLAGLATPEVIPILAKTMPGSAQRDRGLKELLLAQKADYAVIFPTWYPTLSRDPQLVEIKRFYVPNPVALASDQIVAYRIRRTE